MMSQRERERQKEKTTKFIPPNMLEYTPLGHDSLWMDSMDTTYKQKKCL